MKKRILWLGLSFLLVTTLVLTACPAPEEPVVEEPVVEEPVVEEPVVEPPVGVPQYGGTFTITNYCSKDAESPDIKDGYWCPLQWLQPVQEKAVIGDFEKYGPRGTGEYGFNLVEYIPDQFLTGAYIEDWEIYPDKMVWHIRHGIMWHGNKPWVMESREMTVDDVVQDILYFMDCPGAKELKKYLGEIYALDEDSLVIEFTEYHPLNFYNLTWEDRVGLTPPELIDAGVKSWENQVGTGPFMLDEYVVGSHFRFIKNPVWYKTTTINGVEYPLPFVEELITPIIPDRTTRQAAMRTGKLDHYYRVPAEYWKSLDEGAIGIQSVKYPGPEGYALYLKHDRPPFDNLEVRRAMMIGTNFTAFAELYGLGPLPIDWHPVYSEHPETVYTPLEKLPLADRILYEYDPAEARKILAAEGWPDGFTVKCMLPAAGIYEGDNLALLVYQWEKIGVTIEVNAVDGPTNSRAYHFPHEFAHMFITTKEVANPLHTILSWGVTGSPFNAGAFSDPALDALADKIKPEVDLVKRDVLIKEALVLYSSAVPLIPLRPILEGHYWWPWVRNYWGENYVADYDMTTPFAYAWLDQELKTEMGY